MFKQTLCGPTVASKSCKKCSMPIPNGQALTRVYDEDQVRPLLDRSSTDLPRMSKLKCLANPKTYSTIKTENKVQNKLYSLRFYSTHQQVSQKRQQTCTTLKQKVKVRSKHQTINLVVLLFRRCRLTRQTIRKTNKGSLFLSRKKTVPKRKVEQQ